MFSCDCCPCSLVIGAIVAFVLYKLFCCKKCCKRQPELLEKNYKKDVVYLYQFPRAQTVPNMSPYCLKVEAFLRLNKIDYESRFSLRARGKHGLLPFIELNGEQIADSQIIEEKLKKHFNVQPLASYDESISRAAARLISHHTTSVVSKYRYVDETDSVVDTFFDLANMNQYSFLKPLAAWFIRRKALKKLKSFGLFSDSDFDMLLRKDLDVVKGLLGEKNYLLEDKISNGDASIFGHVATWYYTPQKGYVARVLDEDYPTIVAWLERVKTDLFPTDFTKN